MLSKLIGALETIEEIKNQCRGYITVYCEPKETSVNLRSKLFDKLIDTYTISQRDEVLWEKSATVNGIKVYALYYIEELNEDDLTRIKEIKNEKV
nr:MAG TPA: hypothetical protein [Caudoviricetes sp.]